MRKKLGEVLREAGLIDEMQLETALSHQRSFGGHLGRILIDSGFLSEHQLVETLSRTLGVPRVELAGRDISPELLAYVPLDFAEKFHTVPIALRAEAKGELLFVAMSDPTNLEAVDTLQFQTGKRVMPMIATESEVEGAIRRWYYGERPRELSPRSLEPVQFSGRELESKGSELDDIPVITGSVLEEPPAPEAPDALSGDWFLGGGAPAPSTPPAPPTLQPSSSSPFAAATPMPEQTTSSPFAAAPPAPQASSPQAPAQPSPAPHAPESASPTAPLTYDELFGAPNSFLGRDDDTDLGQTEQPPPTEEAPLLPDDAMTPLPDEALVAQPEPGPSSSPSAAAPLPVAKVRLDDGAVDAALLAPLAPQELEPLEPVDESAASLEADAPPEPPAPPSEPGPPPSSAFEISVGDAGMEPPAAMPGFEDLGALADLGEEGLPPVEETAFEAELTGDLEVGDAGFGTPRPLPPPGGVVAEEGDVDGDAPIEVVNMPPDRRPVHFEATAPARPSEAPESPFGDPLADVSIDDGLEALDIEEVSEPEGAAVEAPSEAPAAEANSEEAPPPEMLASLEDVDVEIAEVDAPDDVTANGAEDVTEDIDLEELDAPPAPPLSAHTIHELERVHHDGTTTLSGAGLVDTAERVAGEAGRGEVMTLALPTPAFSHAAMVDAPWRLADEPPPTGWSPDVRLAPIGLSTARLASVDDVASLVPPAILEQLAEQESAAAPSAAVALPGAASPPPPSAPETVPLDELPEAKEPASRGLADVWRDAAEQQLLERAQAENVVVPERRRALDAPAPAPVVEAPRPLHPYAPSAPSEPTTGRPPWAVLVDEQPNGVTAPEQSEAPLAEEEPPPPPAFEEAELDDIDVAPAEEEPPSPPAFEDAAFVTPIVTPPPADEPSEALDDAPEAPQQTAEAPPHVQLPAATPRSVLVADAVHLGDDLTPESSPPTPAAPAPEAPSFAPTPTMITRMSPEELRALAERLVQRGALTADDIDAARKAKEAAEEEGEEP